MVDVNAPQSGHKAPTEADLVKERRRLAGQWLKQQRKAQKLTQKDLAKHLALEYYTFISQIESGHGRVPSALYVSWALALQIETTTFARKMVEFYDPHVFHALGFEPTMPKLLSSELG